MSETRISKHNPIEVDGVRASYDIYRTDTGYAYEVSIGQGFRSIGAGRGVFAKPAKGKGTLDTYVRGIVEAALRVLIAKSYEEAVYVVISDMPGFGEKRLGAHVRAGYNGLAKGGPRYVVKASDSAEADAIVAKVEAIKVVRDGGRSFSPKVVDITNHALVALDGSSWDANDAVTYIAAQRAEDAVVDGAVIGG